MHPLLQQSSTEQFSDEMWPCKYVFDFFIASMIPIISLSYVDHHISLWLSCFLRKAGLPPCINIAPILSIIVYF